MGFVAKSLLLLLTLAVGILGYIAKKVVLYVGTDILTIICRLFQQGSLQFGRLTLRPRFAIKDFALTERKSAGGATLFHAKLSIIDSPFRDLLTGSNVDVVIQEAKVFVHLDRKGQLRWLTLLEAVDAVKDIETTPPAPILPAAGSQGSADSSAESSAKPDAQLNRKLSSSKRTSSKLKSSKVPPIVEYKQVPLTADISAYILHLHLRDSLLELPEQLALIVGDNVNLQAALGMPNVALHADATPVYDIAWCRSNQWPQPTAATGSPLYPIVVDAQAQHCRLHVQGWRTTTGLLLQQPISLRLDFTPAFIKFALKEVHPLLGCAAGLQGDSSVQMTVQPLLNHIPADCYSMRIQPMKMVIGSNTFLSNLLGLLQLSKMQSGNLEAWTSTVEADYFQNGQVISKRMDILLGSSLGSCKGVHVIMWGQIDTVSNVLDMTLGIPADTLAATGIKNLPSDYVLPVPVKGSPQAPLVNWAKAVAQLTELSIKRQVSKGMPWLSNVISTFGGPKLDMTDYPIAPAPIGELPWEAQQAQQEDLALGADLIEL